MIGLAATHLIVNLVFSGMIHAGDGYADHAAAFGFTSPNLQTTPGGGLEVGLDVAPRLWLFASCRAYGATMERRLSELHVSSLEALLEVHFTLARHEWTMDTLPGTRFAFEAQLTGGGGYYRITDELDGHGQADQGPGARRVSDTTEDSSLLGVPEEHKALRERGDAFEAAADDGRARRFPGVAVVAAKFGEEKHDLGERRRGSFAGLGAGPQEEDRVDLGLREPVGGGAMRLAAGEPREAESTSGQGKVEGSPFAEGVPAAKLGLLDLHPAALPRAVQVLDEPTRGVSEDDRVGLGEVCDCGGGEQDPAQAVGAEVPLHLGRHDRDRRGLGAAPSDLEVEIDLGRAERQRGRARGAIGALGNPGR